MIEPIRRLQKKVIRIIPFLKFKEHTGPLFKEPLISPLDDINKEAIALSFFHTHFLQAVGWCTYVCHIFLKLLMKNLR